MFEEFDNKSLSLVFLFLQLHSLTYYNFTDMTSAIIHELQRRGLSSTN